MDKFMEQLKKLLGTTAWKKLNLLMLIGAAGILLMVLANLFNPGNDSNQAADSASSAKPQETASNPGSTKDISGLENDIAAKLEGILSQINGVGEVKVTVNLASTPEKDFAVNSNVDTKNTQERDTKGGNRSITETNEQDQMVLVRESQGSKEDPVVVKEKKPEVRGVVVVADGVRDPVVKADVMNATQVFLDIPLYRVIVLEKESR